jgi:predicted transcriptional regulator
MDEKPAIIQMTTDIVSAYLGQNRIAVADLPAFIKTVHDSLAGVAGGVSEPIVEKREPAVSVRRSITPDFLICLEDGRKFKSLKRHLRTKYGISPEEYRAKWGLPKDYPMVAPNYAAARSELAKKMGLGSGGRQPAKSAPAKARAAKAK